MQSINAQFDLIRQSATVAMADRILALKASGKNIIGLQVGDPDFGTPPAVVDAALNATCELLLPPSCFATKEFPMTPPPRF